MSDEIKTGPAADPAVQPNVDGGEVAPVVEEAAPEAPVAEEVAEDEEDAVVPEDDADEVVAPDADDE